MAQTLRGWTETATRVGFVVRGVLYFLLGLLALSAVFGVFTDEFGDVTVRILGVAIGLNLFIYAGWRTLQALLDRSGSSVRLGRLSSGILHASLGIGALQASLGARTGLDVPRVWLFELSHWRAGAGIFVTAGALLILFALFQIYRSWTVDFGTAFDLKLMTPRQRDFVVPFGRMGHFARGLVLVIVGAGIVQGGLHASHRELPWIGQVVSDLLGQAHGVLLLCLVACGLITYAILQGLEAQYRRLGCGQGMAPAE